MKVNKKATLNPSINSTTVSLTHEGAIASKITPIQELSRSTCSCLLFEKEFYEDEISITDRIKNLVPLCHSQDVIDLTSEIKNSGHLRHVPLFLARELARHPKKPKISKLLYNIIQRPDELSEFLALYWKDGKQPISNQVKLGLAKAFTKFNEYQLAKYNRDSEIKLRDVLFMCHAKPLDSEQEDLWKRLVNKTLATPDTWEVALSGGQNKKETWERLLKDKKLGYLALLKNLRNMVDVYVDEDLIKEAILTGNNSKILPFRYLSALKYAPTFVHELDIAITKSLEDVEKLKGKTVILLDVSGSMFNTLSAKSDLERFDAGIGLTIIGNSICDESKIFAFGTECHQIPAFKGLSLIKTCRDISKKCGGGTDIQKAVETVDKSKVKYDRIIIITDEQSFSPLIPPKNKKSKNYVINIASYKNGINYKDYTHINGFSENTFRFISEFEKLN